MPVSFPKGFLWGAATAAHQVEGGNENQWSLWEARDGSAAKRARKVERQMRRHPNWPWLKDEATDPLSYISGLASHSYALYKQDANLLTTMHMNAYRFSIEWSRVEPQEGVWDTASIEHYRAMLEELQSHHIEPLVTLFHFSLPIWFANLGGFEKRQNIHYFTRFVEKIMTELGEQMRYVITINEPEVYSAISYCTGMWPPAKRNPLKAWRVLSNLSTAHSEATRCIHTINAACQVSVAKHSVYFYPKSDSWLNRKVTQAFTYIVDDSFMKKVVHSCDFIGINYYQSREVSGLWARSPKGPRSDLNWVMQPGDIEKVIMRFHKKYSKPIIITENGLADAKDSHRKWWIDETLKAMTLAIQQGADLKGYMYWSLIDNFEWAYGKYPRFGLAKIDYKTQTRTLRPSAVWFGEYIKRARRG